MWSNLINLLRINSSFQKFGINTYYCCYSIHNWYENIYIFKNLKKKKSTSGYTKMEVGKRKEKREGIIAPQYTSNTASVWTKQK